MSNDVVIEKIVSGPDITAVYDISRSAALECQPEVRKGMDRGAIARLLHERGTLVSAYPKEHYRQAVRHPDVTLLLAKSPDGEALGFAYYFGSGYIDHTSPAQQLNAFCIEKLMEQGQGVPVAVMKQIAVAHGNVRTGIGSLLYGAATEQLKQAGFGYLCAAIVSDGGLRGTRFDDGRGILLLNETSTSFHENLGFVPLVRNFVYKDEVRAFDTEDYLERYKTGIHVRTMYAFPLRPGLTVREVQPPGGNHLNSYFY